MKFIIEISEVERGWEVLARELDDTGVTIYTVRLAYRISYMGALDDYNKIIARIKDPFIMSNDHNNRTSGMNILKKSEFIVGKPYILKGD